MQPGLKLIHKAAGETSFQHVEAAMAEVRARGMRKEHMPVCHGGALDPFASGLLLLLFGPATRLFEHLHAAPKTYVATVAWGVETDNGDLLGAEVARGDVSRIQVSELEGALKPFLGWTGQVPPPHSNKWVDGERAYARAHRGEVFELPPSRVYLHSARWLSHDLPRTSTLELTCRGGYYVRSLARDLGRALGCRAHLAALHRTAIGPWQDAPGFITGPAVLPWAPSRLLNDQEVGELRAGRPIARGALGAPDWSPPTGFPLEPAPPIRGVHQGKLRALLRPAGEGLESLAMLRSGI